MYVYINMYIYIRHFRNQLVLIVQNVDHMTYLMEEFLRKLLLMRVTVIHTEIASRYSVETISILEGRNWENSNSGPRVGDTKIILKLRVRVSNDFKLHRC